MVLDLANFRSEPIASVIGGSISHVIIAPNSDSPIDAKYSAYLHLVTFTDNSSGVLLKVSNSRASSAVKAGKNDFSFSIELSSSFSEIFFPD